MAAGMAAHPNKIRMLGNHAATVYAGISRDLINVEVGISNIQHKIDENETLREIVANARQTLKKKKRKWGSKLFRKLSVRRKKNKSKNFEDSRVNDSKILRAKKSSELFDPANNRDVSKLRRSSEFVDHLNYSKDITCELRELSEIGADNMKELLAKLEKLTEFSILLNNLNERLALEVDICREELINVAKKKKLWKAKRFGSHSTQFSALLEYLKSKNEK